MVELAKIEKVDLREVWSNEAADFTPWLEDNINQLGEALGMSLEIRSREAPVGSFSLDLLAHDMDNDHPVVIENQLEETNHDHLGKLLTYAAGYDASVIVWMAKEFRDEHRAALEFLNGRTDEGTEFFGVVVEIWKIDKSSPAVNFKLVATPNDWHNQTKRQTTAPASARGERYREFFQPLMDKLREDHRFTSARTVRKAMPKNWCSFSAGKGIRYGANFNSDNRHRVEIYIDNGDREWNKQLFNQLLEHKKDIESELCDSLAWEPLDNKKASRISDLRQGSIDDDEETLQATSEWMFDRLIDFERVFGPILAELVE